MVHTARIVLTIRAGLLNESMSLRKPRLSAWLFLFTLSTHSHKNICSLRTKLTFSNDLRLNTCVYQIKAVPLHPLLKMRRYKCLGAAGSSSRVFIKLRRNKVRQTLTSYWLSAIQNQCLIIKRNALGTPVPLRNGWRLQIEVIVHSVLKKHLRFFQCRFGLCFTGG